MPMWLLYIQTASISYTKPMPGAHYIILMLWLCAGRGWCPELPWRRNIPQYQDFETNATIVRIEHDVDAYKSYCSRNQTQWPGPSL